MSENDLAKVQKSPKMNQESVKIPENFCGIKMFSYLKEMIF